MYKDTSDAFPLLHLPFSVRTLTIIGLLLFLGGVISGTYRLFNPEPAYELPPPINIQEHKKAEWNTYRNEELGFLFMFPPSWQQGASQRGGLYLSNPAEGHIEILPRGDNLNFSDRPAGLTPEEREKYRMNLDQFMELARGDENFKSIIKTTLNGYNAYELDARAMEAISFIVMVESKSGFVVQLMFDDRFGKNALTDREKQVLSTFRFIEPQSL